MTSQRMLSLWVAACGVALFVTSASFGQQMRRYTPETPTVSPYVDLLRFNDGGLPNYYGLVRPQLKQRAINNQGRLSSRQQSITLGQLQNDFQKNRLPIAPTGTGSWFMRSGARSTFLDTSRYYPQTTLRTRRR